MRPWTVLVCLRKIRKRRRKNRITNSVAGDCILTGANCLGYSRTSKQNRELTLPERWELWCVMLWRDVKQTSNFLFIGISFRCIHWIAGIIPCSDSDHRCLSLTIHHHHHHHCHHCQQLSNIVSDHPKNLRPIPFAMKSRRSISLRVGMPLC